MGQSWIILQHAAWEGPGLIAVEAKARGLCLDVRRLDQGASIPDFDQVNGLVVMGGPVGAYETDKYPFLTEECRLLGELAHRNCPVLGSASDPNFWPRPLGQMCFQVMGRKSALDSWN